MTSQLKGLEYLDVHQHWRVSSWRGTPVVVFDDDRATLTALWEARQVGWIREKPVLIRLDAHHDQWPLSSTAEAAWLAAVQAGRRRDIAMSVEFDVGCDDADWVRAAALAGLAGDVVTFYVTERPDPPPLPAARSLLLGPLGSELAPGGRLAAPARADVPGWDAVACRFGCDDRDYVLSIDLDAFTTTDGDGDGDDTPRPWSSSELEAELTDPRIYRNRQVRVCEVLRDLAVRAALVTIAREPSYCGGDLAAARLLRALEESVFDGGLNAR